MFLQRTHISREQQEEDKLGKGNRLGAAKAG